MLRFGPPDGPLVLAAPALFEEANRTRALLVGVLRLLAADGIGFALPDLPGQGESPLPTIDARLTSWRQAFAEAAASLARPVHILALRGGALVDAEVAAVSRWYLSPQTGQDAARELRRLRQASGGADYAGNEIGDAMLEELDGAAPTITEPLRVVRLDSDARAADRKLAAAPPWRASEPVWDAALAATIAQDVRDWIRSCGA